MPDHPPDNPGSARARVAGLCIDHRPSIVWVWHDPLLPHSRQQTYEGVRYPAKGEGDWYEALACCLRKSFLDHIPTDEQELVARYPKPQGELIFLGSISTDPEEPETSLNRKSGSAEIDHEDRMDNSVAVRQEIHSELSNNARAILKVASPSFLLFDTGLKAEGCSEKEVKTSVEALNVRAEIFIPDKSYVDKTLGRPEVTAYVKIVPGRSLCI